MMYRGADILTSGWADVASDAALEEACDKMAAHRVDVLLVSQAGQTCGVITETDILRHVSQNGGLSSTPVSHLMQVTDA
jgi:predicted transcriptional regulator